MANPEHLAFLKLGVERWNAYRRQDLVTSWDLAEADLTNVNLEEMNLREVVLRGANLREANLTRADLSGADLSRARLGVADLSDANLGGTNLRGADLQFAYLVRANLTQTDLEGTNLNGVRLGWTTFADVDLRAAKGLDSAKHTGPSSIGLDTLFRSRGKISSAFLRGAGVPEIFIEYMASLVGKPVEFYSCFISYSAVDESFAERLHNDLQAKGVRCWFAPHNIAGGKKIHEQIDEAIRLHEKLLLILSPASMSSEWVKTEIAKARRREVREKRQVLFPVSLVSFEAIRDWENFDADTGKDSAREIREYFIPDFSQWETNQRAYRKAFDQLLTGLKSADSPDFRRSTFS